MEKLKSQLEKFYSSFQAEETVKRLNKSRQQNLIDKILSERDDDLSKLEQERNLNLLSFIYFIRDEIPQAYDYNSQVLKLNPQNLIATVNKAWFQWYKLEEPSELDDKVHDIEVLHHNKLNNIIAKAEVAYTFSRLGVTKQSRKACALYREIHEECFPVIQSCQPDIPISKEYMYIWTFGYYLVQRRCLHTGNMTVGSEIEPSSAQYKQLLEIFLKTTSTDREHIQSLHMARLYVELGMTIFHIEENKKEYPNGLHSILSGSNSVSNFMHAKWYFDQALLAKPNDCFILERCGKYFKYVKDTEKAISCLEKCVAKKSSSPGFHHLGLAYKQQLVMEIRKWKDFEWQPGEDGLVETWTCARKKKAMPVQTQIKLNDIDVQMFKLNKNPRILLEICMNENRKAVETIFNYFDRANEITENPHALYDKGLLLRQTRQFYDALKVFEQVIKNNNSKSSNTSIANAFEQSALCVLGLKHTSNVEDDRTLTKKMKFYLKSAIEIQCKLSENIPRLKKYCWNAVQILKEIVENQQDNKDKFEELRFVYEKEENYEGNLIVLDKLLECGLAVSEKANLVQDKVKCLMKLNQFDDAVVLLEVFKKDYGHEHIEEHLYKSLNITAGISAFQEQEKLKAKLRLRSAFDFRKPIEESRTESEDSLQYDIFILSNLNNEDQGHKLTFLLKETGIEVTSNADTVPGHDLLKTVKQSIFKSNHFVIISDIDAKLEIEEHLISCIQSATSQSNITVVNNINHQLPEILHMYESIEMDFSQLEIEDNDLSKDRQTCNTLVSLLKKVLRC